MNEKAFTPALDSVAANVIAVCRPGGIGVVTSPLINSASGETFG